MGEGLGYDEERLDVILQYVDESNEIEGGVGNILKLGDNSFVNVIEWIGFMKSDSSWVGSFY